MKHQRTRLLPLFVLLLGLVSCQSSDELAQMGMDALQEGKKVTALRFFEEALRKDREHPLSLFGKGKILLESNITFNLGQQMIEKSLPHLAELYLEDAYLELSGSYARSNQYEKSVEILQQAEENNLKSKDICYRQVYYNMQLRKFTRATTKVATCLESYPGDISLQILSAQVAIRKRQLREAISILEKAHEGAPENKEIIKKLAIVHYMAKDTEKSISYLKLLLQKQEDAEQKQIIKKWIQQVKQRKWEQTL